MKLVICYVRNHGVKNNERIILKALDNIDIGSYMLADTTYISGSEVSNKLRHTFWLPDQVVNKDDLIVIYTKEGKDTVKSNKSGNKTYFFYWGINQTVWNKNEDSAALFLVGDWSSKKV